MFNTNNSGYSLSDIAAVTKNNDSNNDGGFGSGNGAWWIIILFLFVFCGWGNDGNGWGNRSGSGSSNGGGYVMPVYQGTTTREEISYGFDMNGLENGIRSIQNGLCDGFYALNNTTQSGFAGVDNAVCTLGYQTAQLANGIQNTIQQGNNSTQIAMMQGFNGVQTGQTALSTQLAQCCCDNRAEIADVKYQMATDTCAINTNNSNNTRDIIDSQNAGTRAILEAIQQGKIDAMQDKIASLTAQNNQLAFQASQAAQNAYLVNELRPCPVPAYITCNPWGCNCGNGYNSCATPVFFSNSGCCNN